MGCHFLLQWVFPTQRSNPSLLSLLHWQRDSSPLRHLGSPVPLYIHNLYSMINSSSYSCTSFICQKCVINVLLLRRWPLTIPKQAVSSLTHLHSTVFPLNVTHLHRLFMWIAPWHIIPPRLLIRGPSFRTRTCPPLTIFQYGISSYHVSKITLWYNFKLTFLILHTQ